MKNYHGRIELSLVGEQIQKDMRALGDRVSIAVSRALSKTERWLRTHSMREIGRELNISQKSLKVRYRIKREKEVLTVWFGLLNIAAHAIGAVSQNAAGVRVRGRQFDGAFYKSIYGSSPRVYIRARRNAVLNHATYTADGRHRKNKHPDQKFLGGGNRGRFPVEVIGVEIESIALPVLRSLELRVNDRYQEILAQEINFLFLSMK